MHALLIALTLTASGPKFIEDDYGKALKTAKTSKKLLFVDAWAPWCHSCVAMKEQVFSRDSFKAFEKDVVFASVDTEKTKSAAFLEKYPVEVWPTLLIIDPANESVVLKWLGSVDEAQMQGLLEAARSATGATREADTALGKGDLSKAAERYRAAVEGGDVKARTVVSLIAALSLAQQYEPCARTTVEQLPTLTSNSDRVAALSWGLGCALGLPEGKSKGPIVDQLVRESSKALTLPDLLPDDRSGLYETLVMERDMAHDTEGSQKLAADWLTFLDGEAAKAKTPAERAVFDPHRLSAAISSKQAEKMVEPLLRSEKELPKDYNPSIRLAVAYGEIGKIPEGLQAADRALGKCKEGPRKLRLYEVKASLQKKKGDAAGRKKTLQEAIAFAKKLPKGQRREAQLKAFETELAEPN